MELKISNEEYQNAAVLTVLLLLCALCVFAYEGARTTGKVLGFLAFYLLFVNFLVGLRFPFMKRLFLKLGFKGSVKVSLHCWLSFVLLEAAVFHGATHMIRKETNFLDRFDVILGMISALFMLTISLNGLFQRQLVKRYGFKAWHLIHLVGFLGAIAADIVHVFYAEGII